MQATEALNLTFLLKTFIAIIVKSLGTKQITLKCKDFEKKRRQVEFKSDSVLARTFICTRNPLTCIILFETFIARILLFSYCYASPISTHCLWGPLWSPVTLY